MGFKSSADLSESMSEGALEKWDFLKPQVAGSSRAGCQHGALEYHVKWFIFLVLLRAFSPPLVFFFLYYFLISCHRALPTSHESQPGISVF